MVGVRFGSVLLREIPLYCCWCCPCVRPCVERAPVRGACARGVIGDVRRVVCDCVSLLKYIRTNTHAHTRTRAPGPCRGARTTRRQQRPPAYISTHRRHDTNYTKRRAACSGSATRPTRRPAAPCSCTVSVKAVCLFKYITTSRTVGIPTKKPQLNHEMWPARAPRGTAGCARAAPAASVTVIRACVSCTASVVVRLVV